MTLHPFQFLRCSALMACLPLTAAPISPNDPSISGSLDIWLSDAANQFDGSTWLDASGNNNHATAVGFRSGSASNYPDATYSAGTASTQYSVQGVAFSGATDDLMRAGSTYNSLTDVTIFLVYATDTVTSGTRPVGIGSQAAKGAATASIFNMDTDGSLRYDNGNNAGSGANPTNTLLVRAMRLDSGAVTDWIDTGSGLAVNIASTSTPTGGSIPNPLSSDADAFYLGDVRSGSTRVGGPDPDGATNTANLFIAQAVVYRSALSDQEVNDVSEWLRANPAAIPEPSTLILLGMAGLVGMLTLRRRR